MSLFDYDTRPSNSRQNPQQGRSLYPSLTGDRKSATSKLFDLSMDDLDDISDLDNISFGRMPRATAESQQQDGPPVGRSRGSANSSFQMSSSPNNESSSTHKRPVRSLSFDEQTYLAPTIAESLVDTHNRGRASPSDEQRQQKLLSRYGRDASVTAVPQEGNSSVAAAAAAAAAAGQKFTSVPDVTPAAAAAAGQKFTSVPDVTRDGHDSIKYTTPAAYRQSPVSSLDATTTTKVRFNMDNEVSAFATPAAHTQSNKADKYQKTPGETSTYSRVSDGSLAATATKVGGGQRGSSITAETPAYKLPPHLTHGSTVTNRWKRRGRLGLAKPKRYDPSHPSDDSGNGADGDSSGMGLGSSPPGSLDFTGGPSSLADAKSLDSPHPVLNSSGTMPSGSAVVNTQRHSIMSIDDSVGDVEHTFNASNVRRSSKSPSVSSSNHDLFTTRGSANANSSFEGSVHNRSMDINDVSMNSNPKSRAQSPDIDSDAVTPVPPASSSSSRVTFSESAMSPGEHEAHESAAPSDSARRRGMSPSISRPKSITGTPRAHSGSSESIYQRTDHLETTKQTRYSPNYGLAHGSPRQQKVLLSRSGSTSSTQSSSSQTKRMSGYGDAVAEPVSRFQQYEKRMGDSPPQYRSPRDRQRTLSNIVLNGESAPLQDTLKPEESTRPRLDQFASVDLRPPSQRLQSGSGSARLADRNPSLQRDDQPEPRSAGYSSPKSAPRRAVQDSNNFDALRNMNLDSGTEPRSSKHVSAAPSSFGARPPVPNSQSANESRVSPSSHSVQQQQQQQQQHNHHHHSQNQPYEQQRVQTPVSHQKPQPQPQQQSEAKPTPQPNMQPASEPQPQQQTQATQQAVQAGRNGLDPKRTIVVNNRVYQKISITGRGGSSKVYKAMSAKHEIFAIKRVSFSRADPQAIEGYVNEILLLRKFEGNPHIIQLFDAEINKERGLLHMVMEFGETDLASVLKRHGDRPLSMNTIRVYWEQMLRAVQTIHEERVVHADLKPANYLLVKGSLKLIDFGIAKAIGNDTTNIHRENQIGTVNYMSPEAIKETNAENGKRLMKLGRASDIWSLGIILYQMCYGRTPFAQLALFKKLASIPDPTFQIPYPRYMAGCLQIGTDNDPNADASPAMPDGSEKATVPPDLLRVMKVCLQRDPAKRMTIPDLLVDPLLCPISLEHALPSAMAQMLSLLKRSPQVLDQWDISEVQNERVLSSLVRALHQQEQNK
ncbi:Dual-specificity kinase, spindle pole body (SPB) duplication and spindle checkpoint function [Dipsacomyces acuminosporus]|nr:Dual-specificity kinase, spindle pole body (SPB) duplication and spindle checkpoint function [Dipsacomyces acuminosporus]